MNKVVLVGRLSRDPELRNTQSGTAVAGFTVACDRRYAKQGEERQADFISCVAWGKTAEFVNHYFKKGMRIALDGRIQTRTFEDQNGNKRYVTEVIAEGVEFAQSKNENFDTSVPSEEPEQTALSETIAPSANGLEGLVVDDEDLPF